MLHLIIVILALICFGLATIAAFIGLSPKLNLVALGLFLWLLSTLV